MSIDWSLIPSEFHYLRNQVLDRYGSDCRMAIFDKALGRHVTVADKLTTEELGDLAKVYLAIGNRNGNFPIIDWIKSTPRGSKTKDSAWELHGLLFLFAELANRGVEPFCRKPILIERPPPPLDWNTLPPSLGFVKEAVERYLHLDREGKIAAWLSSATDDDIRELEVLAGKIKSNRSAIETWQKERRGTQEEFKVHWLGMILDQAGMDFE